MTFDFAQEEVTTFFEGQVGEKPKLKILDQGFAE
jgi:hypothetical protein